MRILLVDDDSSVTDTLAAMLKTIPGHDVRAVNSGEQALITATEAGGVDLLITDVVMEPMDGFTLRDHVLAQYPNARTIFITGYDLSDYAAQTEGYKVLQKPLTSQSFLGAVHRELAALMPTTRANSAASLSPAIPDVLFARATPAKPAATPAAPAAVPVAVPAAVPVAVPVATPAAVPVAKPVAVPAAAPAVKVAAVAQPAAPKAVPTAQPAVAKAVPTAQPVAKAVPAAAPVAKPVAVAKPAVAVAAAAAPVAVAAAPVVPARAPLPPPPPGAGESLIGQTVGSYQIVSYLGEGHLGSAYAAVQISINRPVGLKVLDPERAQDDAAKGRFIADARAKAHVQHPSILAVYEAGEAAGRYFFAREYVDGQSLAEYANAGRKLPEQLMLKVLRTVAEGFLYFQTQNIPHHPLDASKVFVGMEGHTRLANLAVQVADEVLTPAQELHLLGQVLGTVADTQAYTPGLRALINRLQQAPASGLNAWGQVIQAAKALEPKVVPTEAAKITAQDEAAIKAVELARKSQRKSFWFNVASLTTLFGVVVYLALQKFVFTNERKIQRMVKISAGTYKLPSGRNATIEQEFWIDKYEVTIAQYQRFLDYLDKNGTEDQEYRHPKMPRQLLNKPEFWDIYYKQARVNGKAHSVPIDLNCPAITVTWWDAYAYAKWLGRQTGTERDIPTEDEWEVAASGGKGLKYPWGNEFEDGRANTNLDYHGGNPKAKGEKDGYVYWGKVDGISSDKSLWGVIGMGGNVAEWTNTWTKDNKFPIIKGGSFFHPPTTIDKRISDHSPDKGEEWLGFRTISRTAPPDAE